MKFIIVAHPRSGTHLLGTLLNSHPELKCYDELCIPQRPAKILPYKKIRKPQELQDGEGFIEMYRHIIKQGEVVEGFKIIHLTRDLRENAISYCMLRGREKLDKSYFFRSHHFCGEEPNIKEQKIDERSIERAIKTIKRRRKKAMSYIDCPVLEVNYEDLCQNKSLSSFSKEKARSICKFLEVEPMELTTPLIKSRKSVS